MYIHQSIYAHMILALVVIHDSRAHLRTSSVGVGCLAQCEETHFVLQLACSCPSRIYVRGLVFSWKIEW